MKEVPFTFKRPLIIGHRGFPARYPENTMVSFEAAVREGVGMIELDTTLSRDSELVVIHDDTLDRTTSGTGPVNHLTLPELRKLDAGGWFHRAFVGERIPRLEEVLDAFTDRVMVNIEIKQNPTGDHAYVGSIVEKTLRTLDARAANQHVLISSFDTDILKAVAGVRRRPAIALLLDGPLGEEDLRFSEKLGVLSIHPDMNILDIETVNRLQAGGFLVFPYNGRSEKQIVQSLEMGVDGYFVDDPGLVRAS